MKIVNNFKEGDEVWHSCCEFGNSLNRKKTNIRPTRLIVTKRDDGLEAINFQYPRCGHVELLINGYTDDQLRDWYRIYRRESDAKEEYNAVVLNRIDELSSALEKTKKMLI